MSLRQGYGASAIVYTWLKDEAPDLLRDLKEWIDVDVDDNERVGHEDLPSYALARLAADEQPDTLKDPGKPPPQPLCRLQGRLYTEDLRNLLAYRGKLPRPVLVEHLGRLTALHLGLYLLRTYKAVVELERTGELACADGACLPGGTNEGCPHSAVLVVDCGEDTRSAASRLAQASWQAQEDVIAKYVRAHLTLKKLQELADGLMAKRPLPTVTLEDLAAVRRKAPKGRLDDKARDRIASLLDDAKDDRQQLVETRNQYRNLDLADFDAYMALLFQSGERRWFNYLRYLLDSLFLKNEPDGLMRQPLGGRRVRRFALSAGMLETLALVALVHETERGLETSMMPVSAVWAGPESNRHLNAPTLMMTETRGSTPFRLDLHVGDVGHALMVGPTGAGKSVLLALLALQFRRFIGAQVVLFDRGRSARAAALAMGGASIELGLEGTLSLQPLARIDEPGEIAFALQWITALLTAEGVRVTPDVKDAVWTALRSLASAPKQERTLTGLAVLIQSNALVAGTDTLHAGRRLRPAAGWRRPRRWQQPTCCTSKWSI